MTYLVDTKEGFTKPVVKEFGRDGNALALDEVLQLCAQYSNLEPYDSEEEEEDYDDGEDEFDDEDE